MRATGRNVVVLSSVSTTIMQSLILITLKYPRKLQHQGLSRSQPDIDECKNRTAFFTEVKLSYILTFPLVKKGKIPQFMQSFKNLVLTTTKKTAILHFFCLFFNHCTDYIKSTKQDQLLNRTCTEYYQNLAHRILQRPNNES